MSKQGMGRPEYTKYSHNDPQEQVPEIQGPAKTGNKKAGPINAPNWARDDYKSSHVDKD